MKNFKPLNIRFLICFLFCTQNISYANPDPQKLAFDVNSLSFEELNYETCKIYRQRTANYDRRYSIQSLELSHKNMGGYLISRMCDFAPFFSGTPRQLKNKKHYDYKQVGGKEKYIPKSGFRELDFPAEAEAFVKKFQTHLPNCDKREPKNFCFGAGVVWNGFYLGEWSNEKPNGQGIQLLTRGVPFGFDKKVWNSIYRGAFKDGMFYGEGKFFNLKQSFEGNWFRSEMHGKIDWQWPVIFDFGFAFVRHKKGIVVSEISPFGPAESAGLKVGDIISTITHGSKSIRTNEVGIKSIDRFLNEVDANNPISIKIYNKELNDYFSTSFSKTQRSQKDQTAMFCVVSRNEKCYEKSILKSIFIDNGRVSQGSYLMGMRHAFTQDDLRIYREDDLSLTWQLFCYNQKPPWAVLTRDQKTLDKIKFVTPSVFIFDTGYNTPCLKSKGFPMNANSFAFPHLLKENQESLKVLSDLSGLYKIDIIDYLDDFINQLDSGISPKDIKSIAHDWCNYDLLYIYCGYGRSDAGYVIHQKTKIIDNPESASFERKKQMQYIRAEENYMFTSSCIAKYIDLGNTSNARSQARTCIAKSLASRISFWSCVYRGKDMANCSTVTNSASLRVIDQFKMANPDALDGVDLNEWIFGDL